MPSTRPAGPSVDRRTVVRAGAWTVPIVSTVVAAPAYAVRSVVARSISISGARVELVGGSYHVRFNGVVESNPAADSHLTVSVSWSTGGQPPTGAYTGAHLDPAYSSATYPLQGSSGSVTLFDVTTGTLGGAFDAPFTIDDPPTGVSVTLTVGDNHGVSTSSPFYPLPS
jgi:hypothetical protein